MRSRIRKGFTSMRGDGGTEAVIFDMDGVLIDSEVVYMRRLGEFVREAVGRTVPEEQLVKMVGATGNGHWEAVKDYLPTGWDLETFRFHYRKFGKDNPIDYRKLLFPEVLPTLEWLRTSGYRIVMATSTPGEKAEEIKEVCGFGAYMEFILCGDMFKESKPNPEIYLRCLELLSLPREKCLVVEDSAYGIEAAVRAGIPVAVRREKRFYVNQEGGNWYIDSLAEIPGLLGK